MKTEQKHSPMKWILEGKEKQIYQAFGVNQWLHWLTNFKQWNTWNIPALVKPDLSWLVLKEQGPHTMACEPVPACCLLLYGLWVSGWGEKSKEQYFTTHGDCMKFKSKCPQMKLCWSTAMLIHVCSADGCLYAAKAEPSNCNRDPRASKAGSTYYLNLFF